MNYAEAMRYIEHVNHTGSIYGLERVRELERRMGHPAENLKMIHVTGTNGKGSFCAFLSKILEESGYVVGRFISPTILNYRERIQKNGEWITETLVSDYMTEIKSACEAMVLAGDEHPTAFEIETVMAFMYFRDTNCDFVLLEVGMGGRGDSTNMIPPPVLSVMTSVGLDHTAILGDSLEKIAEEKAGIIKGNPALIYDQDPVVMKVAADVCKETGSQLHVADFGTLEVHEQNLQGQRFDFDHYKDLHIRLLGTYQLYNAAAAVKASEILDQLGFHVPERAIYDGLEEAKWPGRFEVLQKDPWIVVDGAHNPAGAAQLKNSIEQFFGNKEIVLIAGIFADKDYDQILSIMSPVSDTIILHKPMVPRGLETELLAVSAGKYFSHVISAESLGSAVDTAKKLGKDVIVSFGSLSTVGELYDILLD